MKKLITAGFLITAVIGFVQPAQAGDDRLYYPRDTAYDSHGRNAIVSKVQRALQEDGYHVGLTSGQFCYETRVAVRRFRKDHGLPIVGKIDETFLRALGFQERDL